MIPAAESSGYCIIRFRVFRVSFVARRRTRLTIPAGISSSISTASSVKSSSISPESSASPMPRIILSCVSASRQAKTAAAASFPSSLKVRALSDSGREDMRSAASASGSDTRSAMSSENLFSESKRLAAFSFSLSIEYSSFASEMYCFNRSKTEPNITDMINNRADYNTNNIFRLSKNSCNIIIPNRKGY